MRGHMTHLGHISTKIAAAIVLTASSSTVLLAPAYAADEAAHAIAEKFGKASSAESKRKADEAEMLKRARIEAEERKKAQERAAAEAVRKADAEKRAELQRFVDEAEAKLRADGKRAAERKAKEAAEREKRKAARLEAERSAERLAREVAKREAAAASERKAKELAEREAAERQAKELAASQAKEREERHAREAAERKAAESTKRQAAAAERHAKELVERRQREKQVAAERMRQLESKREEEGRRLTEKLKKLEQREALAKKDLDDGKKMSLGAPSESTYPTVATRKPAVTAPPSTAKQDRSPVGTRVTVLLVIEPGKKGIRRYGPKTADPILCIGRSCWISGGADAASVKMTRRRAFGPGNTLGRRAAACNRSLTCIFRNIDLAAVKAPLQLIDLRIMRHDRRQELSVGPDKTCDFDARHLSCATLYRAKTWRAWIVPEHLAERIGPEALKTALEGGLSSARSASLDTFLTTAAR
jgi:hypothetical protein